MRLSSSVRVASLVATMAIVLAACGSAAPSGPLGEGREIYANICSVCHGSAGQGGVGPSFEHVAETFSACDDHQRWVSLGSDGWKAERGATYGDTDKEVKGGMPGHGDRLTPEEIAAVAAFERSQYGGVDPDVALQECGLDPHTGE